MEEDSRDKSKVIRGTTALLTRELLSSLIGIVYFGIVVSELGLEGMAVVDVLSMLYTLFPLFTLIAIPTAIQKLIAEHLGRKDENSVKCLIRTSYKVILVVSAISLIASFVAAPLIDNTYFAGKYLGAFQLVSLAVTTYVASSILSSIFLGFQLYEKYGIITFVASTLGRAISIALIFNNYGPSAFVASWIIENILTIILLVEMRPKVKVTTSQAYPIKPILNYSLPLFGSTFISYLGSSVFITLLILSKLSTNDLGIYRTALWAVGIPRVYQSTFLATFFPHLSKIYGEKGIDEVGYNVDWAVRLLSFIFSPLIVGLGILAGPLFYLLGREFKGVTPVFLVFLVFSLINFTLSPFSQGMQALGYTKRIFQVQLVSTIIAVVSSLALQGFGVLGVATGAETLGFTSSIINYYYFTKYVRPRIDWRKIVGFLFASLAMVPPVYLSTLVLSHYRYLPLQVVIGIGVYIIIVRAFKLVDKRDLDVITSIFPTQFRSLTSKLFGV